MRHCDSSVDRGERCPWIINKSFFVFSLKCTSVFVSVIQSLCAPPKGVIAMQHSEKKAIFWQIQQCKNEQHKGRRRLSKLGRGGGDTVTRANSTKHQLHCSAELIQSAASICQSHQLKADPSCPASSAAASLSPDSGWMAFCWSFLTGSNVRRNVKPFSQHGQLKWQREDPPSLHHLQGQFSSSAPQWCLDQHWLGVSV